MEHVTDSVIAESASRSVSRKFLLGLLAVSIIATIITGIGFLSEDAAFLFGQITFAIIPVGAGIAVMAAAATVTGRARTAWLIIGAGVLAWGLGEVIWVYYEVVKKIEVPYPGWADVFYVLGYPLMFGGVLTLPHVKPRPLERIRLSLDAFAGTIAGAAIMWVTYLGDQIYFDGEVGLLEQFVNIMYPFGDAFLLVAVMILAVRRSSRQFDKRLLYLGSALVLTAAADVVYVLQIENDAYVSGGRLDALWLASYGAFVAAGWFLAEPDAPKEQVARSSRLWQLFLPYAAIFMLFGLTLVDIGGEVSVLEMASGVVGLLIIARQAVAIRENRELVEHQRDDLIASISHELRTPLTGVTGFTALLNSDWDAFGNDERAEMITIIDSQAQHVNRIVTDLVGIARGTLHDTDLDEATHDVEWLCRDAVAMVPELAEGTIVLSVVVEDGLLVFADRIRLVQVLVNLLTNAVRYGGGHIRFNARLDHGRVLFEVHDSGSGVPKRYEEAIWDRFERGDHRLDAAVPGSGIGLPIARSLVEAHHGTIQYRRSEQLGGAAFIVSVPDAEKPAKPAAQLIDHSMSVGSGR